MLNDWMQWVGAAGFKPVLTALLLPPVPALADIAPAPEKSGCKCSQGASDPSSWAVAACGLGWAVGVTRRARGERSQP